MSVFMITLSRAPWAYPPPVSKLDWSPKATRQTRTKVWEAVQIQYKLVFSNNSAVKVQGINTYKKRDVDSLGPTRVHAHHINILKLFIGKRWILSEVHEDVKDTLAPKELSLLCAYILYYDQLMDHFIANKDDVLLQWLYIEKTFGGFHSQPHCDLESVILDSEDAIRHSVALWGMESVYNANGSIRGQDADTFKQIKTKVLKWIKDHFKDSEEEAKEEAD